MKALVSGVLIGLFAGLLSACGGGGGGGIGSVSSSGGSTSGGGTTGGSSSGTVNNALAMVVNAGPSGNSDNEPFVTLTVCVHGTSTCQTVNNILVDTGSYGLRILASALSISPAVQTNSAGASIGECTVFADGYSWGPVSMVDMTAAGEKASALPIQIIGASQFAAAPSACTNGAGTAENTVATFGANGVLGVGVFAQDCGSYCATNANADVYFACSASGSCTSVTESLTSQVQNPVPFFASDNNGVVLQLPTISQSGALNVSGTLYFGIGTQSNNALGSASILTLNSEGEFTTNFNNTNSDGFIDSGSTGYFFASSIATCSDATYFYCPSSTLSLSAQMTGQSGTSVAVPFFIANADQLSASYTAFNDIGGPTGSTLSGDFDWGLPFFYGRTVFFAIQNQTTPAGKGPYNAF